MPRFDGVRNRASTGTPGRVGLDPLPAQPANKPDKRIGKFPTNSAVMRLVETAKKRGRTKLSQHWQSTGDANAIRSAAARAELDQEAGERQQLDANTPAC